MTANQGHAWETSQLPGAGAAAAGGGLGAGGWLAIVGAAMGAIGSFYGAKSQQSQLKSRALSEEFQASIATLNAESAELDAQAEIEVSHRAIGLAGLQAAQERGATRASQGASGVDGTGSAAEVLASQRYLHEVDRVLMTTAGIRQANASRQRAQEFKNEALLAGVSARNLRRTSKTIKPGIAAFTSLVGSASQVGGSAYGSSRRS